MANITFHRSSNAAANSGFYDILLENIVSLSTVQATFLSPASTVQTFVGNFAADFLSGTITGYSETFPTGGMWWEASGLNLPLQSYYAYAAADDIIGLRGFALRDGDSIAGSAEADTIWGFTGGDTIAGNAGADSLHGNQGNDTINGGAGADVIAGGKDNDLINGNMDNDSVSGNLGDDTVHGGKGDDTVAGGAGNDDLYGGLGNDILTGGDGGDLYYFSTNSGNDRITDYSLIADVIVLQNTGITSFDALRSFISSDASGNALVTLSAESSITLQGIAASSLSAVDFAFI